MMNFASPIHFAPMFEPDGAINADDRAHMINLYSGIALDSPGGGPTVISEWITRARRRRRR